MSCAPRRTSGKVPDMTTNSVQAAFDALSAAFARDVNPSLKTRLAWLSNVESALLQRQGDAVAALSADFGVRAPEETLVAEVFLVLSAIRHLKKHVDDWMRVEPRAVSLAFAPGRAEVRPMPLGVVGVIAPWNYPLQLSLLPVVTALAAGNRVLLKPSEFTPSTNAFVRSLLTQALPEHVVTVVEGAAEVSSQVASLPLGHLLFTGSTAVGRKVMAAAAQNLTPVTLELGGKSPAIVGKCDLDKAALSIMTGKLYNAGQTCIAPDYALVPRALEEAFVRACVAAASKLYPTWGSNPDATSVINAHHYARLEALVAGAGDAKVTRTHAEDSDSTRRRLVPCIVQSAPDASAIMQEEIFGPLLPVVPYDTLDEAIAYVRARPQPLALYLFEKSGERIEHVLNSCVAGGVTVNDTMLHIAQDDLPFGGVGPSGMGAYHGKEGFLTFTKMVPVFHQSALNATGLLRPPYGKLVRRMIPALLRGWLD